MTLDSRPEPADERLLPPGEVATLFGVDPRTLREWAAAGKIKARRTLGGHRRYKESEVRAALATTEAVA
jgi:excisionase family DNA binding protein